MLALDGLGHESTIKKSSLVVCLCHHQSRIRSLWSCLDGIPIGHGHRFTRLFNGLVNDDPTVLVVPILDRP